jgi:hypothetical protein
MLDLLENSEKMGQTIFLSKPSYLPIYQPSSTAKHTDVWRNFITSLDFRHRSDLREGRGDQLKKWNGRLINDVVVFDSDKDKMWFILRWS